MAKWQSYFEQNFRADKADNANDISLREDIAVAHRMEDA